MTIREEQIRKVLANDNLTQETKEALQCVLRGIFNYDFHNKIKDIERNVKI